MKIPLIRPYLDKEIKERVLAVLESGYLTEGPVTKEFEEKFSEYTGCSHSVAVTSCTTGLEMALRVLGIGPGDEVIVPDYTYPATASVVNIVGARAVLTDVSKNTMLIDMDRLEEAITPRTKAVIPVSIFGNPLDYTRLNRIKERYGVFIIEDAACSAGAEYNGRRVGNLADISVFSFHPRKFITTGEGGMITTNNDKWAEWLNSYKHFGMKMNASSREDVTFEMTGTNYKLSNLLAAIGLEQLRKIDMLLERRRELAMNYTRLLKECQGVGIPETTPGAKHSYQSFCVFVENRNDAIKCMRDNGIEVQIGTYALHRQPAFRGVAGGGGSVPFPGSSFAFDHCLTLPLFHELTYLQQETVAGHLLSILK